jgi:hypothetical protein
MANIIRIKRRAAAGAAGAPGALATSELAYNEADNILYVGYGDNGSGSATSIKALAGEGSFTTLGTTQTITALKTFSGGATFSTTVPTMTATLNVTDNSTNIATTAFVKGQNYLTGNETITVSGDATGSGTTAITLTLANSGVTAGTYTKLTVNAKGLVTTGANLEAADIPTLSANKISDFDTQVRTSRLDQLAAPTAAVSMNSQLLTNLLNPVSAQDAATKNYVDTAVQGLDVKQSVRAASSTDVTISAPGDTIGGVTMVAGDRVLLFGQATGSQNGIYVFNGSAVAMTRASDADTSTKLSPGSFFFVEEGTFGDNGYVLVTDGPITLGTTALTFTQFSGAGQLEAGGGLVKSGNTLNVGAGTGITVNADDVALAGQALAFHNLATSGIVARTGAGTVAARTLTGTANRLSITDGDGISGNPTFDISSSYVGQTTITTLGTIATGVWQGTAVALGYGGTGANLSATADGSIYKKSGTGLVAATAGTDYLNDSSTINGGTF